MEWLRFRGLAREYGSRLLFSDVSGVLRDGDRIGLVGRNGVGKSSLLRILVGEEPPDAGEVVRPRGISLGYLNQRPLEDAGTLREVMSEAYGRVQHSEAALRTLEAALSTQNTPEEEARLLILYGEAYEHHEHHDSATLERRVRATLDVLGFSERDLDRPLSSFSGGQRTRAALARVLVDDPDIFVLDEPTNHLDVETIRRLEELISSDNRPYLLVSHDRYFLDRVATAIWEIDEQRLQTYESDKHAYAAYLIEREARHAQRKRDYESWLEVDARRKAALDELKTHGSHNYSQVRSREKALAKQAPPPPLPPPHRTVSLALQAPRKRNPGIALCIKKLAKSYGALKVFSDVSLDIARGERLAVVGPNGAGKSTFLRIIGGELTADSGKVILDPHLRLAFFTQESAEALEAGQTATEAVIATSNLTPFEARSLLGRLGLSGDAGDRMVEACSGGERRRIMLARLMAQSADILVLDEPTNDLDIVSKEALELELSHYPGTLIIVSHDRYLLSALAERVLDIRDGHAQIFESNYEIYEEQLHRGLHSARLAPIVQIKTAGAVPKPQVAQAKAELVLDHEGRKRLARLKRDIARHESEITKIDARKSEIEREFAAPQLYEDAKRVELLTTELKKLQEQGDIALSAWTRDTAALEELTT